MFGRIYEFIFALAWALNNVKQLPFDMLLTVLDVSKQHCDGNKHISKLSVNYLSIKHPHFASEIM